MNIAIWGTKNEAVYLAEQLKQENRFQVKAFIDGDSAKQGKMISGLEIMKPDRLVCEDSEIDAVIIAVRGTYSRQSILHQIEELQLRQKTGIFKLSYYDYHKKIVLDQNGESTGIIWFDICRKAVLPYLEVNVSDSCNLKCKGCTHFANLFPDNTYPSLEGFRKDIKQLAEKVQVLHLRLLGGEPLLNPELPEYIACARKILPCADICIATNGLLIPRQSRELLHCMRENETGFYITQYPPTISLKEKIEIFCKNEKIDFVFDPRTVDKFCRNLAGGKESDGMASMEVCHSKGCRFLRDGRLYKCPYEGLLNSYFEFFGFPERVVGGIDIYDEGIQWRRALRQLFIAPVDACGYCSKKMEEFDWKISASPKAEDWVANSEETQVNG